MAIICNKKHFQTSMITGYRAGNKAANNDPLPTMSQNQIKNCVKKLVLYAACDIMGKFHHDAIYIIDADAEVEGLIVNNIQRQKFQSEIQKLCIKIKELV